MTHLNQKYRKIIATEFFKLTKFPQFKQEKNFIHEELGEIVASWRGDEREYKAALDTLEYINAGHSDRVIEGTCIILMNAITQHKGLEQIA